MGKLPFYCTDSEDESPSSSTENFKKKKKKVSILKTTFNNVKKKKCKMHSRSEPEDTEFKAKPYKSKSKLHGILKHDKESASEDEDELDPVPFRSLDRCLVGRVPKLAGSRPDRGGGVFLVVRKNTDLQAFQSLLAKSSRSNTKQSRSSTRKLGRKKSY